MAVVVEPLASFMVENLCNFLIEEGRFLGAVSEQVDEMKTELRRMQSFLVDADRKRRLGEGDALISNCFVEIRELAYDAEEVIATFVVKVAGRRSEPGCFNFKGCFRFVKTIPSRRMVGRQIQEINNKIAALTRSLQTYKVELTAAAIEPRITYSTGVDETVVGLEDHVTTVVAHLKDKNHARVISISGMGGLGKTTFSKEILRHREIKNCFERIAWVCVSQQCNPRQVWRDILIQFAQSDGDKNRIRNLTPPEMVSELDSLQREKKCLVILDDIWEQLDWNKLNPAFPRATATGSKILLTTRNQAVVSHDHDTRCFSYKLPLLEKEQCLEILKRKLSRDRQEFSLTPEQKEVLEEIVEQCDGLPLAIVLVGGILAEDSSLEGCKKVRQDLSNCLNKPDGRNEGVHDVLALSYLYLPYHLKACFLYLSLFPEDYDIESKSLVQMWIAEGFVSTTAMEESRTRTSLDVGLSYLNELVTRCIVEADITKFSRRIRSCRLHDLMREFCRKKAIEENFSAEFSLQQSNAVSTTLPNIIRRLAVNLKQVTTIPDGQQYQHARSCFVYWDNDDEALIDPWDKINSLFKSFKFLKVFKPVNLSDSSYEGELSEDIGKLIHLRYLCVRISYRRSRLPICVGNLILLQTLDLRSNWSDIPDVLWKLKELRHLYLPDYEKFFFTRRLRLAGLSKLETLVGFDTRRSEVGDLATLPNLRKLHIGCGIKDLAKILDSPIFTEPNSLLQRSNFNIVGDTETQEEHNTLCRVVSSSPSITKLGLYGRVYEETFLHSLNAKITMLSLCGCGLKEDPMAALQKMPNLRQLILHEGSYMGKKVECLAPKKTSSSTPGVSFPQLFSLRFWDLEISEWKVEEGALPCLSYLVIGNCEELNEIPDGLRFISTLETVWILNPNETLKRRLQVGGQDFHKIQHVPDFRI